MAFFDKLMPARFRGATISAKGSTGLVPFAQIADRSKFLKGDGTWGAISGGGDLLAANNLSDLASASTARTNLGVYSKDETAAQRNALAPRGGLAFDGTNGNGFTATLTGQSFATDPFSVSFVFRVPTSAPTTAAFLAFLASAFSANTANDFSIALESSGTLRFVLRGSPTSNANVGDLANFLTNFGGKVVHVVAVRPASGNLAVYINGVAQTLSFSTSGTPPTWQGSITSTYFVVGKYDSSTYPWNGTIYSASLYNLALALADVTEIAEIGGAVPYRFQFGSQANLITNVSRNSDFSAGATDWTPSGPGVTASVVSSALNVASAAGGDWLDLAAAYFGGVSWTIGKVFQLKFDVTNFTGGGFQALNSATGGSMWSPVTANGSYVKQWSTAANRYFRIAPVGATSWTWDNIVFSQVGAIAHYDADLQGVGYQLHDQSTNKLHALLTTTGVTWTKAVPMGYVKALSDGTTSAQALGGGTVLPANCQILRVRARSLSGTPSITLGTSSGGSQIVASVALSTTWKDLTIALTGGINTSAASLWMTASAANVVEVQLAYEQLPA